MLSLNTNIEALKAGLALQTATAKYTQAAERISTGLRINSAKDDPAGLGLANRLKAKLGSFTKAVDNVNQGIAMVQTVDTSLKNIASNLSAMRNLALSSASGTTLAADRAVNQTQFASYLAEMSSIVAATNYNGKKLARWDHHPSCPANRQPSQRHACTFLLVSFEHCAGGKWPFGANLIG